MADIRETEVRRLVRQAVDRALGPEPDTASDPLPSPNARKRVAIGADHGGYALKEIHFIPVHGNAPQNLIDDLSQAVRFLRIGDMPSSTTTPGQIHVQNSYTLEVDCVKQ